MLLSTYGASSPGDKIRAIEALAKMHGWNASEKTNLSGELAVVAPGVVVAPPVVVAPASAVEFATRTDAGG